MFFLTTIIMLFAGTTTPIISCSSANEVQKAVTIFASKGDTVLELGAELGETSCHICDTLGKEGLAVLVDKERSPTKSGRCSFRSVDKFSEDGEYADRVELVELKELREWRDKVLGHKYDVIVLSVGHLLGHDLYMTMLSLASELLHTLLPGKPRALILKSKTLYSLSKRLVHSQRLFDGTTVLPKDIRRSPEPYIIASVKVEEYRKTIPFVCISPKDDVILEVGCHFGRTTKLLDEAGRYCIGADIGPKIILNAKKQYPDISFAVGDAYKTMELLKLRRNMDINKHYDDSNDNNNLGYDVVYADIGGLSGSDGNLESLALLDSLGYALEPRCIVIKSLCMRQLASQIKFFPTVWDKYNS